MKIEEFLRNLLDADVYSLVDEGNIPQFQQYMSRVQEEGGEDLIIRFLMQWNDIPYYMWGAWKVEFEEGFVLIKEGVTLYPPVDFEDAKTFLEMPAEIDGLPFFEVAIKEN